VSFVCVNPAEEHHDPPVAETQRQHLATVPGRGGRGETGQFGHRHHRHGIPERVDRRRPARPEDDRDVVLVHAGAFTDRVRRLASFRIRRRHAGQLNRRTGTYLSSEILR
jgi:hypothetical protein